MKFVAFKDTGWFDPTTDFRLWDHLCRAYGIDLQMVDVWGEVETDGAAVYLFDEGGKVELRDHTVDFDGCYVFGRTHLDLLKVDVPHQESIRIDTPHSISLFGISAASVFVGSVRWQ